MENGQRFYGWKLVMALWFVYLLNMGFPLYAGAVINSYMLKDIVMDRATYGLGFTLVNFFTGGMGILVAAAINRWDIKRTLWIGSTFLTIGGLGMGLLATQPWHYLMGFGVIMGTGMSFGCTVPVTTTCTRWFVQFRGRAIGLVLTASAFGGFIGAPAFNKILIVNGGDWRQGWLLMAAVAAVAGAIVYFFVKERPEELGQVPDGCSAVTPSQASVRKVLHNTYQWTPREVFRTSSFWLVFLAVVACKVPFFFFTAHAILHAKGAGLSTADAALSMGLFTMGGFPGKLIGGWLMDKMEARYVFMMGLCCYIVGCFLEININANSLLVAYIASILIGVGFGWTFSVVNILPGHYYGPKAFASVSGMFLTLAATLSSPVCAIGGLLFDMYKSYAVAFEFCIAVCVMGIIALLFAPMPQAPAGQKCHGARGCMP